MTVRRGLPFLLALLLGTSAALLAACGGGTKGGIPSASAGELKSQIEDVSQAVEGGRCSEVQGQLEQVDERIDALPQTTDPQLRDALRDGADTLRRVSVEECETDAGATTTTTAPEQTETTETPPEDTEPEEDGEPTETTQTPTTTAPAPPPPPATPPPAPTPPPATPVPPQPPPVSPGGGVAPEIPGNGKGKGPQ